MSSEEQDGYEGTGHLPAPAHFAGPNQGIRRRPGITPAAKIDLKKQPGIFKRGILKNFRLVTDLENSRLVK